MGTVIPFPLERAHPLPVGVSFGNLAPAPAPWFGALVVIRKSGQYARVIGFADGKLWITWRTWCDGTAVSHVEGHHAADLALAKEWKS